MTTEQTCYSREDSSTRPMILSLRVLPLSGHHVQSMGADSSIQVLENLEPMMIIDSSQASGKTGVVLRCLTSQNELDILQYLE